MILSTAGYKPCALDRRRELADQVGCRIGTVQALENNGDLGNWPLRMVRRTLLETLGLT